MAGKKGWGPQARTAAAAARKRKRGTPSGISSNAPWAPKRKSSGVQGGIRMGIAAGHAPGSVYATKATYRTNANRAVRRPSAIPAVKAPTRQKAMRTTPTAAAGATQPHAQAPKVVMPPGTINRVQSAAQMYGTGSKQHKAAKKRFGGTGGPYSPKH